MFKLLLLAISFCCLAEGLNVKVSVYYESLCPDSVNFITNQFWPTYKNIGSPDILVDLIPYGKASETNRSGQWVFTCQHGPDECYGNAYHACAISLFSKEESAEFVYCSMSSDYPSSDETLRECASNLGLRWASLKTCYESGQYIKLLIDNGERTRSVKPAITFIPTIVLNDKYSDRNQNAAFTGFQDLICSVLNQQPEVCKEALEVVYIS
ncbi:unnamed protein product [Phyllotreta striolata]|uniref:Gamma-interferon-inducible lysosomal thiol reductase n=1 Tax=Phyllotreta striolata TaxID=444603 RepID=A0A9N9XRZ8_PHYSR|nr:unnamed protein product [Phyllotreta striolata]